MRTDDIIERIRDECPGFTRVDHALTSTFNDQTDTPAAFVSLVAAQPRSPRSRIMGAYAQTVDETVGVFIMLRRSLDNEAGVGANDDLDALRIELQAALVNWQPPGAEEPFAYAGGQLAERAGSAAWREDFQTSTDLRM